MSGPKPSPRNVFKLDRSIVYLQYQFKDQYWQPLSKNILQSILRLFFQFFAEYFLDILRVAFLRCLYWRHPIEVLPGQVHLGVLHEDVDHLLQLPLHGEVEGRLAWDLVPGLHINPRAQEELHQRQQVVLNRQVERELAKVVGNVWVGLGMEI